jgi:signal transduction histidine kinase
MAGLVNTILDFARVEARRVQFQITPVPLLPLLADVQALAAPQFDAKGVASRLHLAPGAGAHDALNLLADPDKTRQILLNLFGNSVKFTNPGGQVTLEVVADLEQFTVRLTVRDTGHGVPAAELDRIFEPFVQIDRERTREDQQGVGLGLTISRDLARAMGGDVVVQSEVGVGSAFTLILPLVAAA